MSEAITENRNDPLLVVRDLCKTMGGRPIINNISFEAYPGEVFGFLGPNGAGKTTTIKMILGLLSIDSGSVEICGYDNVKHFEQSMDHVGGIVENPELYKYLTGRQNLRQYARIRKGITEDRINSLISFVGLDNRIDEKVKRYSLGMKQRLGVAQSLLHEPKLLILDEPTNGLDPAGIKELRDIICHIAHETGACVFVSSHLMSEMEQMCDRVGIIVNGNIIGVKTVPQLIAEANMGVAVYRFTVNDVQTALNVIGAPPESLNAVTDTSFELAIASEQQLSETNQKLIAAGIMLMGVTKVERRLEDIFIEMTNSGGAQIA